MSVLVTFPSHLKKKCAFIHYLWISPYNLVLPQFSVAFTETFCSKVRIFFISSSSNLLSSYDVSHKKCGLWNKEQTIPRQDKPTTPALWAGAFIHTKTHPGLNISVISRQRNQFLRKIKKLTT